MSCMKTPCCLAMKDGSWPTSRWEPMRWLVPLMVQSETGHALVEIYMSWDGRLLIRQWHMMQFQAASSYSPVIKRRTVTSATCVPFRLLFTTATRRHRLMHFTRCHMRCYSLWQSRITGYTVAMKQQGCDVSSQLKG